MGFTPLEGLMMNTRCGDIDPGVIFYIMFKEHFSSEQAEVILNNKSGILGVFNSSSDLREVIRDIDKDKQAKMAFNMYVRRVRAYIAFYALILKKADILVFTDSLGVGSSVLREHICDDLEFLGIKLDKEKNKKYSQGISDLSSSCSESKILVVPTDEENMIAKEAHKELVKDDSSY
jgi:acetate kinase